MGACSTVRASENRLFDPLSSSRTDPAQGNYTIPLTPEYADRILDEYPSEPDWFQTPLPYEGYPAGSHRQSHPCHFRAATRNTAEADRAIQIGSPGLSATSRVFHRAALLPRNGYYAFADAVDATTLDKAQPHLPRHRERLGCIAPSTNLESTGLSLARINLQPSNGPDLTLHA